MPSVHPAHLIPCILPLPFAVLAAVLSLAPCPSPLSIHNMSKVANISKRRITVYRESWIHNMEARFTIINHLRAYFFKMNYLNQHMLTLYWALLTAGCLKQSECKSSCMLLDLSCTATNSRNCYYLKLLMEFCTNKELKTSFKDTWYILAWLSNTSSTHQMIIC